MRPAGERAYRRALSAPECHHHRMSARLQGKTAIVVGAGQTPGLTIGNGTGDGHHVRTRGRRGAVGRPRRGRGPRHSRRDRRPRATAATCSSATSAATRHPAPWWPPRGMRSAGSTSSTTTSAVGAGDATPHRLADEDYDRIMDLNLRSMWRTCKAVVPVMREQGGGGVITNISSIAAIAGAGALTAYKLSKAGVNALTQNLALTNAKHGIRVNAIMPGFIDTPLAVDAPAAASGTPRDEVAARRAGRGAARPAGHGMGRRQRRVVPRQRRGRVHHRRDPARRRRSERADRMSCRDSADARRRRVVGHRQPLRAVRRRRRRLTRA